MSFRRATFTKAVGGGWAFTWGRSHFWARRVSAGLWELHLLELNPQHEILNRRIIAGHLPSRQACVDAAAEATRV